MEVLGRAKRLLRRRAAVMNLAIKQQTIQIMVFAVDMPEDVDILLASTKRKRDAEGIRISSSKNRFSLMNSKEDPRFSIAGLLLMRIVIKIAVVS